MGLKVYINIDMEGLAGIVFPEDVTGMSVHNYFYRERQRRLMTGEAKAAAAGALDAGAEVVYINDNHATGHNLIYEEFEPPIQIIQGRGERRPNFMPCLDESFDAVVTIGMFAKGGTWGAVLSHSLWDVKGKDDHLQIGITGKIALYAGYFNIPTVFVSGDDYTCREAKELIPGVEVGIVKVGLGRWNARSLPLKTVHDAIRRGVTKGIYRREKIKPLKIEGPYKIVVGPEPEDMWHDKKIVGKEFLEVYNKAQNTEWADFGDYKDDGYAWPEKIQGGYKGVHTERKRREKKTDIK